MSKNLHWWFPAALWLAMVLLLFPGAGAAGEEAPFQPVDLPVIYLHIDGGQEAVDRMNSSPDHSVRCTGTMDIAVPEGYAGEFGGRYPQESVSGLALDYIRGRGNGTWGMSKHPYRIKLAEKQDLFGMGKNKHWILLGNYFDNSMIRNWLTDWLGEALGLEFTPQGVFAEVVMNDEYLGVYYLCEQVRIASARVDIEELKPEDTRLPEIQGGYLLEMFPDGEGPDAFETARGVPLGNKSPSFDPENDGYENGAQRDYIREYVQRAEDAVFAADGEGRWQDYLDPRNTADFWWVMEFTVNDDAYTTDSTLLFKKRFEKDGSEGKLYFGPLWDFDEAWGNAMLETELTPGFNNATSEWVNELRRKPEFLALLRERWTAVDEKLEEIVRPGGVLDETYTLLKDAWVRDAEKWRAARAADETAVSRNFEQETEHLRGWINLRRQWISEHMDRLEILSCILTVRSEGAEDRQYEIPCDTWLTVYDAGTPEDGPGPFREWLLEDGTPAGDFLFMDRDITLTAAFGPEGGQ